MSYLELVAIKACFITVKDMEIKTKSMERCFMKPKTKTIEAK